MIQKINFMNKKGHVWFIIIIILTILLFFSLVIFVSIQINEQAEDANKLDKCVSNNYDPYEKEYNYNSIIKCCIRLDYGEAYCLERFKPGYKDYGTKG